MRRGVCLLNGLRTEEKVNIFKLTNKQEINSLNNFIS